MKLKIEMVGIDKLAAYENNSKKHTDEQITQIAASIQEFGMNDPIAIWKDNTIIEGHGRLLALQKLNYTEAPVIRLDGLTDEQRRAYTIVHNKLTLNSEFDIDILNKELESISDIDMEKYGLSIVDTPTPDFYNELFVDAPEKKERILCPYCGEWFEVDA